MTVEDQSLLMRVLGYSPKMRILDYLLDFPTNDFTKKEIIDALGMSKQTFYKYFDDLEDVGIVKVNRAIGKAKLYKVNYENPVVMDLVNMEKRLSLQIAEEEESKLKKPIPAK
ncbi:MAG: winged helix-turn-helix domain-containing protein [Candidatus Nitrosotenuis sp.]